MVVLFRAELIPIRAYILAPDYRKARQCCLGIHSHRLYFPSEEAIASDLKVPSCWLF